MKEKQPEEKSEEKEGNSVKVSPLSSVLESHNRVRWGQMGSDGSEVPGKPHVLGQTSCY